MTRVYAAVEENTASALVAADEVPNCGASSPASPERSRRSYWVRFIHQMTQRSTSTQRSPRHSVSAQSTCGHRILSDKVYQACRSPYGTATESHVSSSALLNRCPRYQSSAELLRSRALVSSATTLHQPTRQSYGLTISSTASMAPARQPFLVSSAPSQQVRDVLSCLPRGHSSLS